MSLTLLLLCRRSIGIAKLSQVRSALLYPVQLTPTTCIAELSTVKSKYSSLKPSPSMYSNPFREPNDEKSRRLKLQEQIRFREKFQLDNDYEFIYAMPRQRMYSFMHLLCTCASITMLVFVVMDFHRDMIDADPLLINTNQKLPKWVTYSVATIVASAFGIVLILIARMPVRLYYSPVRQTYALFYHPVIGVFRQKKVLFKNTQYKVIPQQLDSIESGERSVKIRTEIGHGLLGSKNNFYLIENYFRSKRDINRIRYQDIHDDKTVQDEKNKTEEDTGIWQAVVERKEQEGSHQRQRRTFK